MAGPVSNDEPKRPDQGFEPVLIVGAGPAGLAAAAELRQRGVDSLVIDRADSVASSWRTRYDALKLNTCRWNAVLRVGDRYEPGTPFFPLREHAIQYLEKFAETHEVNMKFGISVEKVNSVPDGWEVTTSSGPMKARQVIVATGHQHTPRFPEWPGKDEFPGRIVHSLHYRNPSEFRGLNVLVIGAGCSGLDIARDLAQGGAAHVSVAVRSQPNLLRKKSLGMPTDLMAAVLHRFPVRLADRIGKIVQRLSIGDLSHSGLTWPEEGIFSIQRYEGRPPVIVGDDVIAAIRGGAFDIVAGVSSIDGDGVRLTDGTVLHPDAIVAATGYTSGLQNMVGHLGVLDEQGDPLNYRQPAIRPGLHFIGYAPCMGVIGRDARRVVRHVYDELTSEEFSKA